ncbi:hypothetical protein [Pseudactinotalea suaedae]|uniref:hypothetical protein n=1 Tax=Pseudactinotalea suaedae TaxID=1524924 RepID=UPI0012E13201|nr:hypothetical protein [Pseudactinotalea suaedae]
MSVRHLTELDDDEVKNKTAFAFEGVSDYWLVPDSSGALVLRVGRPPFAAIRCFDNGWRITWIDVDDDPDPIDAPRWQDALATRIRQL